MPPLSNAVQPSVTNAGTERHRARARSLAAFGAALLGFLLVYGAGFADTEEIHNGAHDARHAAGFPCH